LYLTEKAEGKTREEDDHTEVEMLLESYHKVADEIVQTAENLVSSIRNTEEMYVPSTPCPSQSILFVFPTIAH
jgi:magnesium transporter